VAAAADEAGLPALVIRAVADPAWRDLPGVALLSVGSGGQVRFGAVAQLLLRQPREWPPVARLALDTRAGLAALRRVAGSAPFLPI
jgi:adenosylhomocysteine nucleosidase